MLCTVFLFLEGRIIAGIPLYEKVVTRSCRRKFSNCAANLSFGSGNFLFSMLNLSYRGAILLQVSKVVRNSEKRFIQPLKVIIRLPKVIICIAVSCTTKNSFRIAAAKPSRMILMLYEIKKAAEEKGDRQPELERFLSRLCRHRDSDDEKYRKTC